MPHIRFFTVLSNIVLLTALSVGIAHAQGWSDVGASGRPGWVDPAAERRLRLISALPAIEGTVRSGADSYFGSQGPGLSVGLVLDDGLYYSHGFGFANLNRTAFPDENTIYRAASLSKVMTATGLSVLIDAGTKVDNQDLSLSLAADLVMPELDNVCPPFAFDKPCSRGTPKLGNTLTLAHLVSHTNGLPNVMNQTNPSAAQWLTDLQKTWFLFQPGLFAAYSGVGMESAGLIEQRISKLDFADFIAQRLFAPLGMTHSSMNPQDPTLPASLIAQRWVFTPALAETPAGASCLKACDTADQTCLSAPNTGPTQIHTCAQQKGQCQAKCPAASVPTYSFVASSGPLGGDNQTMLWPAGGLSTTVEDMSLFIKMWLSEAPKLSNGNKLLKDATIQAAATPLFTNTSALPTDNCNLQQPITDSNGFGFSACGPANSFSVGWVVNQPPFIQHNGGLDGQTGSNTFVDQTQKMGATGLISTEPAPASGPNPPPVPPGFDTQFLLHVVLNDLLLAGEAADKAAEDWGGTSTSGALADAVARVLYLSGKTYAAADIGAFTPGFLTGRHLTSANIVQFLQDWHNQVGTCSTFRVRGAPSSTEAEIDFHCSSGDWDVVLTVDAAAPHQIAWPATAAPVATQACLNSCSTAEGNCMSTASSAAQRQVCVKTQQVCSSACNPP
jgi:CubicO group peptidase (beta-lactamase class C family)